MKNTAVAFLFCLTSTIAYANQPFTTNKPVLCTDLKTLIEFLTGNENKEEPQWVGKDETSKYLLLSNPKTKNWTMIQYTDQVACVIGAGNDGNLLKLKPIATL